MAQTTTTNRDRGFPLSLFLILAVLFMGCLFLLPNGLDGRLQRDINLEMALYAVMGILILRYINVALGLLLCYASALCIIWPHYAMDSLSIYTAALFLMLLVFSYDQWRFKINWIYNFICVAALLNVLWAVFEKFHIFIIQIGMDPEGRCVGLMSNANELSCFLAISLPCFFRSKWKWFIPALAVGFVLSRSTVGVIASVVISVLFSLHTLGLKRTLAATVGLSLLLAGYMTFVDPFSLVEKQGERIRAYRIMAQMSMRKPMGYGLGQFKYIFPLVTCYSFMPDSDKQLLYNQIIHKKSLSVALRKLTDNNPKWFFDKNNQLAQAWLQAHNEYLEWWFNAGLLGLLLFLSATVTCLAFAYRQADKTPFYGLTAAVVTSLLFFTYHITPLALMTVTYLGIVGGRKYGYKRLG